jgi:hypothetical protein
MMALLNRSQGTVLTALTYSDSIYGSMEVFEWPLKFLDGRKPIAPSGMSHFTPSIVRFA